MADFNQAIQATLDHEGGDTVTNDPTDAGGLTRYGISQRSYPELDILTITEQQAKDIYKKDYWDMVKGDAIESQEIACAIFDFAVNAGPVRAIKLAQKAINTTDDGMIGPMTLSAWNNAHIKLFLSDYALEKIRFYRDIVTRTPSQKKYLLGWINRSLA
jgi:lysozyme family protein